MKKSLMSALLSRAIAGDSRWLAAFPACGAGPRATARAAVLTTAPSTLAWASVRKRLVNTDLSFLGRVSERPSLGRKVHSGGCAPRPLLRPRGRLRPGSGEPLVATRAAGRRPAPPL